VPAVEVKAARSTPRCSAKISCVGESVQKSDPGFSRRFNMPALSRVLAITSLSFSALTWLGVLVLYASTLTEPGIVLVVVLASAAFLWALRPRD
jgi:hypothetical protein